MKKMIKKTYESPRMKVMPIADTGIMCASGGDSASTGDGGVDGDGSKEAEGKYNFKLLD